MSEPKKPYGTVLIKAAKILDSLAETSADLNLKELAESTGMTTSTTLKILDTLVLIGFVSRNDAEKTYSLGPAMVKYGNTYVDHSVLIKKATPHLEKLHDIVDETIHLGIQTGNEIIYLEKMEPRRQSIYMSSKVGMSRPMYSTAMGKAVLASYTAEKFADYVQDTPFEAFTENTITNQFVLEKELAGIKQSGVAFDDEEMEKDCFCIGTTISLGQRELGAFSISMPKFRATTDRVEELIGLMKDTKKNIEQDLQKTM